MANKQVCAVDIKKLWVGDVLGTQTAEATAITTMLKDYATKDTASMKEAIVEWLKKADEIKNIHQDTWSLEEAEASQDSYRNQLNQQIYRFGRKQNGDLTVKFTIGQYDYARKQEFLGGKVIKDTTGNAVGWERPSSPVEIKKAFLAQTIDDQFCFIPYASIIANETDADKAVGIGVQGTAQEHPEYSGLPIQGWYDSLNLSAVNG